MHVILVYITNSSREEARKIANHLINKKLIACANIYDNVLSIYPWQGGINEDGECTLIAKSVDENYGMIKDEVKKMHSYDVPCIIRIKADANKEYDDWVKEISRNI
jgi:periplasmic divalent cation tolerance protein